MLGDEDGRGGKGVVGRLMVLVLVRHDSRLTKNVREHVMGGGAAMVVVGMRGRMRVE